jgi:hypothetical protein
MLPIPLKQSIEKATTSKIGESLEFVPIEPTEFCKLNYKVSDENNHLIAALSTYISVRMWKEEYKTSFDFLGFKFNFGYSRDEKTKAANCLINVLLGNQPLDSLAPHKEVFSDGLLGQVVNKHLNGRSIPSLIHTSFRTKSYDENFRILTLINQFNEKPSSEEYNKRHKEALESRGENTFIAYAALQELTKNREIFFLAPTSLDKGFLSCGDGHLYQGSIKDIYHELQSELNKDPHNEKILAGVERIKEEILAFPNKISESKKEFSKEEQQPNQVNINKL